MNIPIPKYFVALVDDKLRSYETSKDKFLSAILQDAVRFEEDIQRNYTTICDDNIQVYKIGKIYRSEGNPIGVYYFPTLRLPIGNNKINICYDYEKIMRKVHANPFPRAGPPAFVIRLVKEDAIRKAYECPIIYEPINIENSIVTSCYHVFNKDAFIKWQESSNKCPTCRNACVSY